MRMWQRVMYQFPEALEICQRFRIPEDKLHQIVRRIGTELHVGLARATHPWATVKCNVTYLQELPTGHEKGKFLALDLGGTNFRCLLCQLEGGGNHYIVSRSYVISQSLMLGPGEELFDFIAKCLAQFCKKQKVEQANLPLGFTFSFPLQQLGIDSGILTGWTKGFKCQGVEGHDVVELLRDAIERRDDIKVRVVAVINDTAGTLMACAYKKRDCRIGLVVGTGLNACYVEQTRHAQMFEQCQSSAKPHMIVNTELGAFGDNGGLDFIRTRYDEVVDEQSVNPGRQLLEKCTSGMYLGELVRLIVLQLMHRGVLFRDQSPAALCEKWSFSTRFVSEIETDPPGYYDNACLVLAQLGIVSSEEAELACLHHICEAVSTRSAQLVSCALVALIEKMQLQHCTIGIDGGLFRHHPHFQQLVVKQMCALLKGDVHFDLVLVEDGSGRGAALVAATHDACSLPGPEKCITPKA
ncbi:hypothetical protein KR222_006814, partial [Zaprionus bogoriensis]